MKVQTCREAGGRDPGLGKDQRISAADRVTARLEQPKTRQGVMNTSGGVEFFRHTVGNGTRLSGEPCAPIVRYSREVAYDEAKPAAALKQQIRGFKCLHHRSNVMFRH